MISSLAAMKKFDKLSDSAGRDGKSFTGLMRSLDILKDDRVKAPKFTPNQVKQANGTKRYPKYVRNKSYNVPEDRRDVIMQTVDGYIKRTVTSHELQNVLRDNKNQPQCRGNQQIRQSS